MVDHYDDIMSPLFPEKRVLDQGRDDRDNVQLKLRNLSERILADDRVLDAKLSLTGVLPILVVFATTSPIGTFHLLPEEALWS
jgi:hypothetical protein